MTGRRLALIVANDEYEHEGLGQLFSPAADAVALADALGDRQIGDFDVGVMRNQPSYVLQAHIEDLFADARLDDVLLVHFSCHGLKNESGQLFFAAHNTRPDRLASTTIPASFVQQCMATSRSRRIVLLLDCCYGGAFGAGVSVRAAGSAQVLDSFPSQGLGAGRGRAVITASSAMEYAFEGNRLADNRSAQPSVFTSALVDGLTTGAADRDEDGWVALGELYDYVFDQVRARNPHQTPSRDVQMQGELFVARSRRQRIKPAAIPPDLQAAVSDTNMFTRLGAVAELRTRVLGDNLPAALGAYETLQHMAAGDLQNVASAANEALRTVVIRTADPSLRFGQVVAGTGPATRMTTLLGPPLARLCTVEASEDWIRVSELEAMITVTLEHLPLGARQGSITVKGPTGELVLPVDVEVVSPAAPRPKPEPPPTPQQPQQLRPDPQPQHRRPDPQPQQRPPEPEPQRRRPDPRPQQPRQTPTAQQSSAPQPVGRIFGILAILAGCVGILAGITTFIVVQNAWYNSDSGMVAVVLATAQFVAYGLLRIVHGLLVGDWKDPGRITLVVVGAVGVIIGLFAFNGITVPLFWLASAIGLLVLGRRQPKIFVRRLELMFNALAIAFALGLGILILADVEAGPSLTVFYLWQLAAGVLLILIGRTALKKPAT